MVIFWLILAGLFLAVEFGTVALISVWFVGGALAAMLIALLGGLLWLQIIVFLLVSAILLVLLRPFLQKYVTPYKTRTNVEALTGQEAVVTEGIDNLAGAGAIRLGGKIWTARSADGRPIETGCVVTVLRVEGVKAIVLPAKPPAGPC